MPPAARATATALSSWLSRSAAARLLSAWFARRPFLASWTLLAAAMVLLVVLFGVDAGLTLRQHAALAVFTVGLAWLSTWIVFAERPEPPDPTA